MKESVIKEKDFLKKVHKSNSIKPIENASEKQIKALAVAVHLVINEKVPLTKKIINYCLKLNKSKIKSLKSFFGNKEELKKLVGLNRKLQIKIIKKYLKLIRVLRSSFFVKSDPVQKIAE